VRGWRTGTGPARGCPLPRTARRKRAVLRKEKAANQCGRGLCSTPVSGTPIPYPFRDRLTIAEGAIQRNFALGEPDTSSPFKAIPPSRTKPVHPPSVVPPFARSARSGPRPACRLHVSISTRVSIGRVVKRGVASGTDSHRGITAALRRKSPVGRCGCGTEPFSSAPAPEAGEGSGNA
jgi:hypothetical protein